MFDTEKNRNRFQPFEKKIYLAKPTMHGNEMRWVQEAYETNWMSTVGKNIDEVERLLSEQVGTSHALALSSGTAALHLAIKAAGVKAGDKVFCTDVTFAATNNPVLYEHAEPVFIDTEYDTWNMDPAALEKAFELYPDVRTVICVHLYGVPCKIDPIREIAASHGAVVIEDATEALGARYKGRGAGGLADLGCVSFNGNKIITGTTGGALLSDNDRWMDRARKWSTQSKENAPWYQHEEVGYNYRMSNVVAGIIRSQMEALPMHCMRKKEIYQRYQEGFRNLPVRMNPFDAENSEPNFWLSCMIIDKEAMCRQERSDRTVSYEKTPGKTCPTEILETLASYHAEGRPIWKPMHLQPLFRGNAFISADGNDAGRDIFHRGLCLPSDISMTEEEQDRIIEIVKSCFE
ncbi:MAG: aminotransferase class I/II-fold pyridoxal phosphate-dependent enzyme [Anaerovoracaceae bacterium]|nr:aminotransferase class I/II-fold pyridoxal phosphate-dependent enzyme [Anaerovoracaceae bacterium]